MPLTCFFQSCSSPKCIPCAECWQQLLGSPCTRGVERLSQCTGALPGTFTTAQALQGERKSAHASKAKHKNSLRWQSPSRVQRKCFYSHSRHPGKDPHLEKLMFHHIMYKQSHLETSSTHQMQQPQLMGREELYSELVMAKNV